MIELLNDDLVFKFPQVHEDAQLSISFQRTLRIPDDDKSYSLPPGLGRFPIVHVDDYQNNVPPSWIEHGGVFLPMYQSEAMWLCFTANQDFTRRSAYPFAIKICTGKINAFTGDPYEKGLNKNPQDYAVAPKQPWLDGYCVKKGEIRQFVAMELGEGYTAEEQITGKAEHGGLQITVYPMKAERYDFLFPKGEIKISERGWGGGDWGGVPSGGGYADTVSGWGTPQAAMAMAAPGAAPAQAQEMGLAPGGKMKQEIYKDDFKIDDWDLENGSRCFVHITNSVTWAAITGKLPPHLPPSAKDYTYAGLPWFDYYDADAKAIKGSSKLAKMASVQKMAQEKGEPVSNEPVSQEKIVHLKKNPNRVREGDF